LELPEEVESEEQAHWVFP